MDTHSVHSNLTENEDPYNAKRNPKVETMTHRRLVSKLELPTGEPVSQLKIVSRKVFELDMPDKIKYAKDSSKWHATDEVYYTAKNTYQSVIDPFTELPKVYKLESTKEKLYAFRQSLLNTDAPKRQLKTGASSKYIDRIRKQKEDETFLPDDNEDEEEQGTVSMEDLSPEERMEVELSTAINPFEAPKPWVRKKIKGGKVVYFNTETKEQKTTHPGQVRKTEHNHTTLIHISVNLLTLITFCKVWAEKYTNLERLTPRYDSTFRSFISWTVGPILPY